MVSEITPLMIITKLEQYDYAGATSVAVVMLIFSFILLLITINGLQAWTAKRTGRARCSYIQCGSWPVGFVPTTYYWTFGDGGTSNVAIPTHTYLNNGWYNACLVISGIYNNTMITCTWCDSLYVGNNIQPCAATFTTSISGNTATFTNTATGPGMITGYAWTFGDDGTSTSPNPSHTYANSGWYNVCLTITGIDNGATYSCTWCDSINIQMGGNPCNGVYFTPSQTGNIFTFAAVTPPGYTINTYYWTFGDGGTSNVANPTPTPSSSPSSAGFQ